MCARNSGSVLRCDEELQRFYKKQGSRNNKFWD